MKINNLTDIQNTIETVPPGKQKKYTLIKSKVLNEIIVLAFDTSILEELLIRFPGKTIYFSPEVKELELYKNNPQFIRKIHLVKKKLDAYIVPSKKERANGSA